MSKNKFKEEKLAQERQRESLSTDDKPKDPTKIFIFFWVIPIVGLFVYATVVGRCG